MPQNSINRETSFLTVDPNAAEDSFIQLAEGGTDRWRMGIDEDDGDTFKLSVGSALGTNDMLAVTQNGEVLLPSQPSFMAYRNSVAANVTGNGTIYTTQYDVVQHNVSSSFSTPTFTCPVDGIYTFGVQSRVTDLTAATTRIIVQFITSFRAFRYNQGNCAVMRDSSNSMSSTPTLSVQLDAADTCDYRVVVYNGASAFVDFGAPNTISSTVSSSFYGYLEC